MVDISNSGNSERIKNIHTFLQGNNNPLALSEDITKSVLALEEACEELASSEQTKRARIEGAPRLNKPMMPARGTRSSQQEKGMNPMALLIETFSTIRQLLHEGNIGELNSRLQLLNLESTSLREKGQALLDSFAHSAGNVLDIKNQRDEAKNQLDFASNKLSNSQSSLESNQLSTEQNRQNIIDIKTQLNESKQRLAQINNFEKPITEDIYKEEVNLEQKINVLTTKLTELNNKQNILDKTTISFKNEVETLTQNVNKIQNSYDALLDKEYELIKVSDDDRQKLNTFMETAPRPVEVDGEKWENTLALLTMLTAQLKKAMNEDSIRNMKEQEEVMMKINEASRKDSDKKAKEAQESERKAAEANKAASCASKIFSYVLLAVSVIATVASFGTAAPLTLAIAAIGIAMAVADIVLEETGHGSLMQMLANEISSVVTDMLIKFGVPEEEAKKIGSIVGMIVAAIAFLAISLLSMGSMVKNIVNTVKNAAKLMLKNVGSLLKNTIKSMPKSLMNALGNIATKTAKVSDSVADSADSAVKLSKLAKLSDKFDDAQHFVKTASQVADKMDKTSDLVSLGGQMVKVSDSVADSADSAVKLSKLAKLSDKFDDAQHLVKSVSQATDKVDKTSDLVSLGGQMVKVSDSVADGASSAAKLTKFTKLADKIDDVKDVSKTIKQVSNKADDVSEVSSQVEKATKSVKNPNVAMAKVEVIAKGTGAGVTVASAATTGGLNLHAASMGAKMKEMLAGMMLNNSSIEAITELLNQLIKAMSKSYEQFDEMFVSMLKGLQASGQNKVDMMKTAHFA